MADRLNNYYAPDWREEHALALASFLRTEAGASLRYRMQAMVASVCIAGCQDPANPAHSAGVGAGWNEAVRKLLEMAEAKRFAPDASSISGSASATAEKDGQPPNGEAELLERWSP